MLRILPVEKHAAVAVSAGVLRAFHVECQFEVDYFNPLDERDVVWAANLWFVVTIAPVDPKDMVAIDFSVGPALGIRNFPAFVTFFKILLKNER